MADQTLPAVHVMGGELLCYSMFGNLFKNDTKAASAVTCIEIDLARQEAMVHIDMVKLTW